jgi:3-oxosteroid 1-dehydrogenase
MLRTNHLSRRKFVKRAAIAGGAFASGNLDQFSAAAQRAPLKWDKEADVVCVGYGGAGAITAITAADLGASVVILEKQPNDTATEVRHTPNTRSSGGAIICPTDPAKASDHLFALSWGATPRDICDVWGKYSAENAAWIEKICGTLTPANLSIIRAEFPMFPGSEAIQNRSYAGRGLAFFKMLDDNVSKRKAIQVIYDTPGKELVTDINGMVIGVIGENAGKPVAVKARKAVVLSCGDPDPNQKGTFLCSQNVPRRAKYAGRPEEKRQGAGSRLKRQADSPSLCSGRTGINLWVPLSDYRRQPV